jgi:hypothetical protein
MSTRLKVGFVGFLSCLALMLGMFTSTGVASAYSTQAVHTQTSTSTLVNDRGRCRTFFIVLNRFSRFQEDNGLFAPQGNLVTFNGRSGVFNFGMRGREFHPVFLRHFERVLVITICNGHRIQHTEIRSF